MKLYKIIQEQEEEETPKEVRKITPVHKRMLNALYKMDISQSSYSEIWKEVSEVFQINDYKLAEEISYLYYEYGYLFDEDEKDPYYSLPPDALSEISTYYLDDKIKALSSYLEIPPFLFSEMSYGHYGLELFENTSDGSEYCVGDDDEVGDAMLEWAEEHYRNEGLEYMDRYYLDDYIELNDFSDFVEEEVDYRLEDMDEDDIIEEAGYDKDEMVDNRDSMVSKVDELKEEMDDIETEREHLQEVLDDMELEDEDAYETEEYQEIEEQQNDLEHQWDEKDSEVDDLKDEISELEDEIDNLLETAKEEVRDEKISDLTEEIENEGLDYFIDNLGYSLEDAVEQFAYFDESSFLSNLAENEERDRLASYDGVEEYETINGEDYYIYRVN